jgi:hypothetical protein
MVSAPDRPGADTMSGHARVDSRVRHRPPVVDLITE